MEAMTASSELSSLLNPGIYVMKIAQARMNVSEKNGKVYLSMTLVDDEGYTVDCLLTWFEGKLPDGSYIPVRGQRNIKQKWEFENAIGIPHNAPLERDTIEGNRVPLLERVSAVRVQVGVRTDKKTGFTENSVQQFLPMEG